MFAIYAFSKEIYGKKFMDSVFETAFLNKLVKHSTIHI